MVKYHHPVKNRKNQKTLLIAGGILLLITLVLTWVIIGINLNHTRHLLQNVIEDNQENKVFNEMLVQSFLLLSGDSNAMRSQLGYSVREYPILEKMEKRENEENHEEVSVYLEALEKIIQTDNREKALQFFGEFIETPEYLNLLKEYKLQSRQISDFSWEIFKGRNLYFQIQLRQKDSMVLLNPFSSYTEEFENPDKKFTKFLRDSVKTSEKHFTDLEKMASALSKEINDTAFSQYLKKTELVLAPAEEDFYKITYRVKFNERLLLSFGIDKKNRKLFLNNQQFGEIEKLIKKIYDFIDQSELVSEEDKRLDASDKQLLAMFSQPAFRALLDSYSLHLNPVYHEDNYFRYYDILTSEQNRIGTFAIDKFSGEIYLTDKDEIQICSLKTLISRNNQEQKKKIEIPAYLPEIKNQYINKEGLTFLICGSNEKNTDTMIVVNIDSTDRSITMFGIPRDLYYRGHRLNTVYYNRDAEQFLKELSDITGLKIEKYIHIDMFAFIEVINILGGIDVNLQYDLIDPSYKIKDDGKWGTLHYTKGHHHLNGVQALRVARSRHYSSDFDRSRRQQQILIAIRDNLSTLGVDNLDKISGLTQILFKYVRTNFSVFEIVQYFNQYKDYKISAQHTLDSNNVLEVTYTNIYYLTQHEQEFVIDENFDKGGWILVPRDNDWNLIKWYIRELIEPGSGV